jgi:hypothetical protein
MTAQVPEMLLWEGIPLPMHCFPLETYFRLRGTKPPIQWRDTACWRGYAGTWEVRERRLYLVALDGLLDDDSRLTLSTVFPGFPERVFAHWFTGSLELGLGEPSDVTMHGAEYDVVRVVRLRRGIVTFDATRSNVSGSSL